MSSSHDHERSRWNSMPPRCSLDAWGALSSQDGLAQSHSPTQKASRLPLQSFCSTDRTLLEQLFQHHFQPGDGIERSITTFSQVIAEQLF